MRKKWLVLSIIVMFIGAGILQNISGNEPINGSYDHKAAYNYDQKIDD